jgi:hypothetical protein
MTKYFKDSELACKCCGACPIDDNARFALNKMREELGPLYVTSGYRCIPHNKRSGGVLKSWHTKGKAFDLVSKNLRPADIAKVGKRYFHEVIIYDDFCHVGNPFSDIKLKLLDAEVKKLLF